MSEKDQQDRTAGTPPTEHPAEAKRLKARRRFMKSGAAGSSAVVLTFYHSRGSAKDKGKKINLSSQEACLSLGGQPGNTVKVVDSVTGKKVDKIECDLP